MISVEEQEAPVQFVLQFQFLKWIYHIKWSHKAMWCHCRKARCKPPDVHNLPFFLNKNKSRLAHSTQKQRKLPKLVAIFERFEIFKNQIDDFLDFFKMVWRWIDYECVKVQIILKIISAKPHYKHKNILRRQWIPNRSRDILSARKNLSYPIRRRPSILDDALCILLHNAFEHTPVSLFALYYYPMAFVSLICSDFSYITPKLKWLYYTTFRCCVQVGI